MWMKRPKAFKYNKYQSSVHEYKYDCFREKTVEIEHFLHVEVKQLQGFCINKFPLHILTYCCMLMRICIDSGGELVLYKLLQASNSGL